MMQEIALLDKDDEDIWEDEARALAKINGIWETFTKPLPLEFNVLDRANDGVTVVFDTDVARFRQEDTKAERAGPLDGAVAQLREFLALTEQSGNLTGVLVSELILIRRAVEDHAGNPVMVYNNCRWAARLLTANLASAACPPVDSVPEVGLLETLLADVQSTLRSEPAVRESLGQVPDDSPMLDDTAALKALQDATEDVAAHSDEAFSAELRDNAAVARDTLQPKAVRIAALVRTVSGVTQAWLLARYANFKAVLSEGEDVSSRVLKITKNIAGIGVASGAAYAALQAVANSDRVAAALQAILAAF